MNEEKDKSKNPHPQVEGKPLCTCVSDTFASLPPDLRPRSKNTMSDLRKVTCPGCGLNYWTNRKTDLCIECEKKGVHLPGANIKTGG
jgi:hypothetical protein